MDVVKKVVHVKIEKFIIVAGKAIWRCSITILLISVCQRLKYNKHDIMYNFLITFIIKIIQVHHKLLLFR